MKINHLHGKKIIVVGRGVEGESVLRFLGRFVPDAKVDTADEKDGSGYLKKLNGFDLAIRSPGVPKKLITIPYTTPTNIFFANTSGVVIGITGSKGKSTTASLLYSIMQEAGFRVRLVGNIGFPMLDALSSELSAPPKKPFYYVAELSSYQLDDIEYSPHISLITSFFPDHMDYHGGLEKYRDAKQNILSHAKSDDYYVFNDDFPELAGFAQIFKGKPIPFMRSLPFSDAVITLLGAHNKDNVRAAATIAELIKIPPRITEQAVRNFKPLPHRLEHIGIFQNIAFYDDAISTTPESTIRAIEAVPNIRTLFLGGKDRGYDFSKLADEVIRHGIKNLVLFPESGTTILKVLKNRAKQLPKILETTRMEEAVRFAYENTPRGTACVLSTASPSYSLWKNFEEKGDEFQAWVKRLGKN